MLLLAPCATADQSEPGFHLMAMGDWGENTAAQRDVAGAMSRWATTSPPKVVLLLGDNFYFTLSGPDDPRWQSVFEKMYDPVALNVPFYSCLGNHEYDLKNLETEFAYARQHPESRFKLPSRWYRIDFPKEKPMLTVLMLDSNKDFLSEVQWNEQIKWLQSELEKPRGTWTICCAHHPLYSNGFFWGNGILQRDWGALFEKYHVDFYLCGHEHNLQHLEIPGSNVSYLIAGGGGAHAAPLMRDNRGFSREAFGFADFDLAADQATIRIIGTDDKPMHVFERTKAGKVRIVETTPNSKPVNPLDAYLQLDKRRRAATQPAKGP